MRTSCSNHLPAYAPVSLFQNVFLFTVTRTAICLRFTKLWGDNHTQTLSVTRTCALVSYAAHHMMFKRPLNSKFLPGEDNPHASYDPILLVFSFSDNNQLPSSHCETQSMGGNAHVSVQIRSNSWLALCISLPLAFKVFFYYMNFNTHRETTPHQNSGLQCYSEPYKRKENIKNTQTTKKPQIIV